MSCWLVSVKYLECRILNNSKRAEQCPEDDLGVSGGGDVVKMSMHVFVAQ